MVKISLALRSFPLQGLSVGVTGVGGMGVLSYTMDPQESWLLPGPSIIRHRAREHVRGSQPECHKEKVLLGGSALANVI